MSFTVRIRSGGATLYTFTTTPFVDPAHSFAYDADDPPNMSSITKTWTIEGILYGSAETAYQAFDTLVAALENESTPPDTVQLLKSGTVIESIGDEASHDEFRLGDFRILRTEMEWRGELHFTFTASGKKVITRTESGQTISALDYTDSFSYDERGLLTRTKAGEVKTASGTSAIAAAAAFGLSLPGSTYAFLTNGPDGVDVEQLNRADTHARFVSTYQEAGGAIPSGVGPSYDLVVQETESAGQTVSVTTVTARGTGAAAAVRRRRPSGVVTATVNVSEQQRNASAVYVTRSQAPSRSIKTISYVIRGGGRPIDFTPMTKSLEPVMHVLPLRAAELVETSVVEVTGTVTANSFLFPPALDLPEDASQAQIGWPVRISEGVDVQADVWQASLTRVYRLPSIKGVASKLGVLPRPSGSVTLDAEMQRITAAL